MAYLKLSRGTVYDPTNQIDGEVRDVWICDGKIVEAPAGELKQGEVKTIDLAGRVVMAGAVDMHCHIAGPKVNTARKMQPEQTRAMAQSRRGESGNANWLHSGSLASVPSIFTTGYKYTGLGYTTCFDAAVSTAVRLRCVYGSSMDDIAKGTSIHIRGSRCWGRDCVCHFVLGVDALLQPADCWADCLQL